MGNRGRRRAVVARAFERDPTVARSPEKRPPTAAGDAADGDGDSDASSSSRSDGAPSAEIVAVRRKTSRAGVVTAAVRYADGGSYEGAVDGDSLRHGPGVLVARSGHTFQGEWVRGALHG